MELDLLGAFQLLEEVYSRPFSLFYCFFGSVPIFLPVLPSYCIQSNPTPYTCQDQALWTDYCSYVSGLAFCATSYFSLILFVGEQIQQMKCN